MHLFAPVTVRYCDINNRIVMPPMASEKATEDGLVTERTIEYYREPAKEGIGLVIVEHTYVSSEGKASQRQLAIDRDEVIPGLERLAAAIKHTGARAVIQLSHAGGLARTRITGCKPTAPSEVIPPRSTEKELPRELTIEEIQGIKEAFLQAVRRAMRAGFDGVEIHGAHGYMLNQFNSPLTNKRTDQYGGSLKNRMRLSMEIIKDARQVVGQRLLLYRLGAVEQMEGGISRDEAIQIAEKLCSAGVDIVDVSGGNGGYTGPKGVQGYFVPDAWAIKQKIDCPVIVTGGITDPEFADRIVREEKTDFVGIGRALLKNPDWAKEAKRSLIGKEK